MQHWTVAGGWGQIVLVAVVAFLLNPLHYVATALVIWDLVRNIKHERLWFGVRVTRIIQPVILRYIKACVIGLAGSVALVLLGATASLANDSVCRRAVPRTRAFPISFPQFHRGDSDRADLLLCRTLLACIGK